ncbi:MAG: winged helix-turn-helix domain-containing protein [Sulfuricellaceae bacterium]
MALALFGKTRLAALSALLGEPGRTLHLRQIAREGNVPASAMARELDALVAAGIVQEERQANLRLFRANAANPLTAPLRDLIGAMRSAGAAAPSLQAAPTAKAPRKSRQLALSAPFDWSNPQIPDDALIAKTVASLRFEDVVRLCAHYGTDRVRAVVASSVADPLPRAILDRQLRNIEAAGISHLHERAA